MKLIFKSIAFLAIIASVVLSCGCGEKTPEQIAAENVKKTDVAVRRSKVFLFDSKPKDAIEMLEKVYQECGSSPELCEALGDAYAQDGQMASAAMFFENASDLKGGNPELQINAAKAYEQSGVLSSAIKAYNKYLAMKPQDVVAWKSIANCYEKDNKFDEALNANMSALKASGRNPTSQEAAKIGSLFTKIGNANQARRWLEAAFTATIPENVETRKEILTSLVTVYLAQKETALLEATVVELDKIDPQYIKTTYPKLHQQIAEFRKAITDAQEAIKAAEQKKIEEARIAEEAKKKALQEEEAKAKQALEDAKKTQDKNLKTDAPETEKKLETSDNMPSFSAGADEVAQDVVITDVSDDDKLKNLSEYDRFVAQSYAALDKGNSQEAEMFAHKAINSDRNKSQAWRALAKAYEASNKNNDSFMAAREAYIRNPDDINATLFFLRNASRVQNNEKFLNNLYRAHEKFPNNSEIMVGLARTYKLIGDLKNSKYFYNLFLNNTPKEHPLYQEMYDELEAILASGK